MARRVFAWIGIGVLSLIVLAVVVVWTAAGTDWGREQVRTLVLEQLEGVVDGRVEIGRLEGNLLASPRAVDISVVDAQERPFVEASSVEWGLSLSSLLRQRIRITALEIEGARVVLDQPPGEDWNFSRIFTTDPDPDPDPEPGWGDWVELANIRLADTDVILRMPWEPDPELSPEDREAQEREAVAGETRDRVREVPGGYQSVMEFRRVDASVPRLLVADPDTEDVLVDVERLTSVVEVFETPEPGVVQDLAASVLVGDEGIRARDVRLVLPDSEVRAEADLVFDELDVLARVDADPLALRDLHFVEPTFPEGVGGRARGVFRMGGDSVRVGAEELDVRADDARLQGRFDATFAPTVAIHGADFAFDGVHTDLVESFAPDLDMPVTGVLRGSLAAADAGGSDAVRGELEVGFEHHTGGLNRLRADGVVVPGEVPDLQDVAIHLDPLRADLLDAFVADHPLRGHLEGTAILDGPATGPLTVESGFTHYDPLAGPGDLMVRGGLDLRDGVRMEAVEVGLEGMGLARLAPYLEHIPEGASLDGLIRLDGPLDGPMRADADLHLLDPRVGGSRMTAAGEVDLGEGTHLHGVEVMLDPFEVATVEGFLPDFPLGGTAGVGAVLDGDPETGLDARLLFVHDEEGESVRLEGEGHIATAPELSTTFDLSVHDLSLVTLGRFVPEAELRGAVGGWVEGELDGGIVAVSADFDLPEGARIHARLDADAEGPEAEYHGELTLEAVDAAAISGHVPQATGVDGELTLRGRGTDPATMTAEADVNLRDAAAERERRIRGAARLHDGLLALDPFSAWIDTAELELEGSFGLREGRAGEMTYQVRVDSLDAFEVWRGQEPEQTRVPPRPAVQTAALEEWGEALLEEARAAEVERLATGSEPSLTTADTVPELSGLERRTLSGSLEARGIARGGLENFDVLGEVDVEELVAEGSRIERASVAHEATGVGTDELTASLALSAEELLLQGFAYERILLEAEAHGDEESLRGRSRFAVEQSDDVRIDGDVAYRGGADRHEATVEELVVQVPDATYRTPRPASAVWTPEAIEVDSLRLASEDDGYLQVDGGLPVREPADEEAELAARIQGVDAAHLLALLQDEDDVRGTLALDFPVRGTASDPRFDLRAAFTDGSRDGVALPDLHLEGEYSARTLDLAATLDWLDATVLTATATFPVDLGLMDVPGPRFPDGAVQASARLDDLPVEAVTAFTDEVREVSGHARGGFSLTGTYDAFEIEGDLDVDVPGAYVEPLGIRVRDVAASMRMADDVLTLDSLVVHSRGALRAGGEVDLTRLTAPAFDLAFEAENVQVIDTNDIELRVDADLELAGPFEMVDATGEVRTREGVLRLPETGELAVPGPLDLEDPDLFERVDPILIATRDALVDPTPLLENVRLDLGIFIDRDVWLRAPDLNVEIYTPAPIGPLRIRANGFRPADLVLEGTLQADRGEYEFMGRRLDLARASATFVEGDELEPLLRLTAEHEVQLPGRQAFDIRIILDGTPAELETDLESTSQPPLSETDLLSYLVFGRDAGTLLQQHGSTLSGQASAGGPLVGQFASRATQQFATVGIDAVLTELEAETARSAGLDVLHIKPAADTPAEIFTGEVLDVLRTTEVEAGRYISPRLFVSGQARPTFVHPGARMEYVTDRGYVWSVTWRPRFLPAAPTLGERAPDRASVLGTVLFREWRF